MKSTFAGGTSYIHTQRLSRIHEPNFRFFKYLETVAHELYHQNNPFASEDKATDYGRSFLESWVRCKGTEFHKRKCVKYEELFDDIEFEWGVDWDWRHKHGIYNLP